jgi:hypothetical protein
LLLEKRANPKAARKTVPFTKGKLASGQAHGKHEVPNLNVRDIPRTFPKMALLLPLRESQKQGVFRVFGQMPAKVDRGKELRRPVRRFSGD